MRNYFVVSDDFFYIISSVVKKVKCFRQISSGWTNFVFEVKTRKKKYIFRFPRNQFWAKAIEKECAVTLKLCEKNLGVQTPNLQLRYFENKPFSFHEMISGKPLSKCHLTKRQKQKLAGQICLYLKNLQQQKINLPLSLTSQFLKELSFVSGDDYDLSKHSALEQLEQTELVLCHGDFNSGNIIVKHKKLKGVIDYSFASYSSGYVDLARLVSRLDKSYEPILIKEFEKCFDKKIEETIFDQLVEVWKYVDFKYICHIKNCHPEISLSKN